MATGITKQKWTEDSVIISNDTFSEASYDFKLSYEGKLEEQEVLNLKTEFDYNTYFKGDSTNKIFYGDNLDVLRHLIHELKLREKIKLIYIDPPYGTNSIFQSRNQKSSYKDDLIGSHYIEFIRQRLILMKELLSKDGSIYMHLDGNMTFQIKVIMDEIFGSKNFRGFITRKKCSNKNSTRKTYGNISDYVLFYSKSDKYTWQRATIPWSEEKMKKEYPCIDEKTGRRYKKVPIHAPGTRNGETGKTWKGMMPPPGKHWQYTPKKLTEFDNNGDIYWSSTGNPRRKVYFDKDRGIPVQDIWLDVQDSLNQSIKITGYPTEKNPYLLERIIEASSNEGDIVLDCFAGSGTTLDVAEQLKRKFIGVDSSSEAISNILKRFVVGLEEMGDYVDKKTTKKTKNQQTLFEPNSKYKPICKKRLNFDVVGDVRYGNGLSKLLKKYNLRTEKFGGGTMDEAINHLQKDSVLKMVIDSFGSIKHNPKSSKKGFKYLADSIIGQQLSIKASNSIIAKVEGYFGKDYSPKKILETSYDDLRKLGVSKRKGEYYKELAISVLEGQIDFENLSELDNNQVIEVLTKVKGIGTWTAKMYLIFVLGRKDIFPYEDKAFTEQIKTLYKVGNGNFENHLSDLDNSWAPYQSIAALYMWKSRDEIPKSSISKKSQKVSEPIL